MANARTIRQRRQMLAAHLQPKTLATLLFLTTPDELARWTANDPTIDTPRLGLVWDVFTTVARRQGLAHVDRWLSRPSPWVSAATPTELLIAGDRLALSEQIGDLTLSRDYDFDQVDAFASSRVAVAGDWHGNVRWARKALHHLHLEGLRTVLHLGDFGYWPGREGSAYIDELNDVCARLDLTILVTDGNHEDHAGLSRVAAEAGKRWISDRIAFFERGHRWVWRGHSFVSLGGAASLDVEHRKEGIDRARPAPACRRPGCSRRSGFLAYLLYLPGENTAALLVGLGVVVAAIGAFGTWSRSIHWTRRHSLALVLGTILVGLVMPFWSEPYDDSISATAELVADVGAATICLAIVASCFCADACSLPPRTS